MTFIEKCCFVGTDPRIKKWLLPKCVMQSEGVVQNAESLLKTKSLQIALAEPNLTVLKNEKGSAHAALLLDFGYEFHGGVRLLTGMNSPNRPFRVRLTFGESVAEAVSAVGEKGACNDHSPRDFEVTVPRLSDLEFGQTGYRFLRIELLEEVAEWRIKSIMGAFVYRDLDYIGNFSCDDEMLNRIYDTAAYTCHLNMQTMLWDGIKRDRLAWVGDTHPEMLAIRTLFGNHELVWENLRFSRDEAKLPNWMNGMPSYSFWWLIILYEQSFSSDDFSFAIESRTYVEGLLRVLFSYIREDGTHTFESYFLDWQTRDMPEAVAGVHALLYWAIQCGMKLCHIYQNASLEKKCEVYLGYLKKNIPDPHTCSSANALLLLNELLPTEIAVKPILENRANGLTTLMSYYVLTALARSGHTKEALEILKIYYGGMLKMGATTFWEDFDISWLENASAIDEIPQEGKKLLHGDTGQHCYKGFRHSLCHGWSAGPVAFLAEQVLGIHITEAGGEHIHLSPNLSGLQYAKGSYPTKYGKVEVAYERKGDRIILIHLKMPKQCGLSMDQGIEIDTFNYNMKEETI